MWSKIKSWFGWIAGAVVGFLLLLLKLKNNKIEKQEEKIDDLKTENKVASVEIKTTANAQKIERETAQEAVEVKQEAAQQMEDVKQGKTSYNDLIEGWNNEK